jgi:hypothetical protein
LGFKAVKVSCDVPGGLSFAYALFSDKKVGMRQPISLMDLLKVINDAFMADNIVFRHISPLSG